MDLKEANIAFDISVNVGIPSIAPASVVRVSSVKALVVPTLIVGALAVALILIKGVVIPTTAVATIVLVVEANGGAVVRTDGIAGIGCIAGVNSTDGVSVTSDKFRCRVQNDVRAMAQWLTEIWSGKGGVHDEWKIICMSNFSDCGYIRNRPRRVADDLRIQKLCVFIYISGVRIRIVTVDESSRYSEAL